MYMANTRILCLGPNTTYIPLTRVGVLRWGNTNFSIRVGGNTNFNICVGVNAKFSIRVGGYANLSIFRNQHAGIPKSKFCVWGLSAVQWNIGLKTIFHCDMKTPALGRHFGLDPQRDDFRYLYQHVVIQKAWWTQCESWQTQREGWGTQREPVEYSLSWVGFALFILFFSCWVPNANMVFSGIWA